MKRIISLVLALVFISSNFSAAFAQNADVTLPNKITLYETWPSFFAEDINKYVGLSEEYILAKPSASQSELEVITKSLRESETIINEVLKKNIHNDDFIYDLYKSLAIADGRYDSRSKFSLMYTKDAVNSISLGKTPRPASAVLRETPDFFNKVALDILENSSVNFEFLANKIQNTLNFPRGKAVSLALSTEMQYAKKLAGREISNLREVINRNKYLIRHAEDRSYKQVSIWRKEIASAQKEILELKNIYKDPIKSIAYSMGQEEAENIIALVKEANQAEINIIPGLARNASKAELANKAKTGLNSLKRLLPIAIGAALFLTLYTTQANAANKNNMELEIINTLSNRTELKREILTAVKSNPDNIGIIYGTGGKEVKNMVSELFESESINALSAEELLPYIEDWNERTHTLATDEEALNAYLAYIKNIADELAKQEFNERIQKDLLMPQDNTAIHQNNVTFEWMMLQSK